MSDVTYEYCKGEGWIPSIEKRYAAKTSEGRFVWIVDRQPEPGEYWVNRERLEEPEKIIAHVARYPYRNPPGDDFRHFDCWTLVFADE